MLNIPAGPAPDDARFGAAFARFGFVFRPAGLRAAEVADRGDGLVAMFSAPWMV
jgi:hypothetical protein